MSSTWGSRSRDCRGWRYGSGETCAVWVGGACGWQGAARRERRPYVVERASGPSTRCLRDVAISPQIDNAVLRSAAQMACGSCRCELRVSAGRGVRLAVRGAPQASGPTWGSRWSETLSRCLP